MMRRGTRGRTPLQATNPRCTCSPIRFRSGMDAPTLLFKENTCAARASISCKSIPEASNASGWLRLRMLLMRKRKTLTVIVQGRQTIRRNFQDTTSQGNLTGSFTSPKLHRKPVFMRVRKDSLRRLMKILKELQSNTVNAIFFRIYQPALRTFNGQRWIFNNGLNSRCY